MIVRVVVHINDLGVGDGELAGDAFMETAFAKRSTIKVKEDAVIDFYWILAFFAFVAINVEEGLSKSQ